MSKVADDFYAGLTSTSRVSWIGSMLFTWLEFAVCCLVLQPQRIASIDRHWLMESSHDEYADLTVRVLALRYANVNEPHVTFLGASNSTRSLVAHDDRTMSKELVSVYGKPAHFDVFSTNNQRYEDWLQIADQFPKAYRGVLVLEMHDMKDDYRGGAEKNAGIRRRLALPSTPSMTRIWKAQGVDYKETGVFFIDHLNFFAARRMVLTRLAPAPTDWNGWAGGRNVQRYKEIVSHFERMRQDLEKGKEPFDLARRPTTFIRSRRVLARVVAIMKAHKSDVLLVQSPRFPPRSQIYHARIAQFGEDMSNFCHQFGCHSWDPNQDIELEAEDFQDAVHLNNQEKRREFTDILLAKVSMLLRMQEAKRGGVADDGSIDELPPYEADADAGVADPALTGVRQKVPAPDAGAAEEDEE